MHRRWTWAAAALLAACGGDPFTEGEQRLEGEDRSPPLLEDGGALEEAEGDSSGPLLEDGGELVDANDDGATSEDAAPDSRWEAWGPDAYIGLEGPCIPVANENEIHALGPTGGMCWPDRCECAPGLRCIASNRPTSYFTKCEVPRGECEWSREEGHRCWGDCQCGPGLYCRDFSSVSGEGKCRPAD